MSLPLKQHTAVAVVPRRRRQATTELGALFPECTDRPKGSDRCFQELQRLGVRHAARRRSGAIEALDPEDLVVQRRLVSGREISQEQTFRRAHAVRLL